MKLRRKRKRKRRKNKKAKISIATNTSYLCFQKKIYYSYVNDNKKDMCNLIFFRKILIIFTGTVNG